MANIFVQPCDEGVIRARPAGVPCGPVSEPWIFAATILGFIVHSFNGELDRRLARMEITSEVRRSIDEQRVRLAGAELPATIDARTRLTLKHAIDEFFCLRLPGGGANCARPRAGRCRCGMDMD